ncbi:uncharacterized protein [Diadema antillarum]|uniref:uncharacterized protein n=1 Tax=Diadema antillarum TaxID=105358 RepID=UPI003A8804CE
MEREKSGENGAHDEPQTDEELERLVDKELEDEEDAAEKGDIDARQRAIDEELRKLREELLSNSPDDMEEEYDVAARVKQLNEELAKEGPVEEKKNRKVFFHENIVSMAVPPPEYTEDEVAIANEEAGRLDGEGGDGNIGESGRESGQNDIKEAEETNQKSPQQLETANEENQTQRTVEEDSSKNILPDTNKAADGTSRQEIKSDEADQKTPSQNDNESLPNRTEGDGRSVTPENSSQQEQEQVQHAAATEATDPVNKEDSTSHQSSAPDQTVTNNVESPNVVSGSGDPNDIELEKLRLLDRPQQQSNRNPSLNSSEESTGKDLADDEHVLIERGGKFFYVNVQDLSPEERESLGVMLPGVQSEPSENKSVFPVVQPKPPEKPRPSTATGGSSSLRHQRSTPPRAMSAKTSKEYDRQERQAAIYEEPFGNVRSRYGMTPEQKQFRREQARLRAQKAAEEKEREEREKRDKEETCDGVFKAWLEKKREEAAKRRQEEKERRKAELENKEERFPEEAFTAWMERKKDQKKAEKAVMQRLTAEEREAYFMRSREDCERAFKQWVRSKNASLRQAHSFQRATSLESKKRARQSRKSQNLAKALEVAQAYRYNEYYGYRF